VLDPMCGSGTTCVMAAKNHREYFGIEISREYCGIAEQRMRVELKQQNFSLMENSAFLMPGGEAATVSRHAGRWTA